MSDLGMQGEAQKSDNRILNYLNLKAVQFADQDGQRQLYMPQQQHRPRMSLFAWIILGIIIFLIINPAPSKAAYDAFVGSRSLTDKLATNGWYVFTASYCGYCHRQKEIIGNDYPNLYECDTKTGNLPANYSCVKVRAYPTWYNVVTGTKVEGYLDEGQLKQLVQ
jgi:hypothetical protein